MPNIKKYATPKSKVSKIDISKSGYKYGVMLICKTNDLSSLLKTIKYILDEVKKEN